MVELKVDAHSDKPQPEPARPLARVPAVALEFDLKPGSSREHLENLPGAESLLAPWFNLQRFLPAASWARRRPHSELKA